ncbi:MAG: hypothetical protein LAO79_19835 [Acidobacteriia bacterium]|nr:hypothetical protein [Terriglobia bacterium]
MPRIAPLEASDASLFARFVYWMTKRKIGRVILPVKITAHHPRLLRGMGEMEQAQLAVHSVPETLKELACIRVAMLVGCPF